MRRRIIKQLNVIAHGLPFFLISLYIVLEKDIVNLHISITTTHFLDEDDHRHVSKDELAEDNLTCRGDAPPSNVQPTLSSNSKEANCS